MVTKKKEDYVDMDHDYKLRCLEVSTYNRNIYIKDKEKEVLTIKKGIRLPRSS